MAKSQRIAGRSALTAGAVGAGASGGTALLALVNSIPDGNSWKPLLVYLTPTVSVALSGLWVFTTNQIDYWLTERSRHLSELALEQQLKKAQEILRLIEHDSGSSEDTKNTARAKVDSIRLLILQHHSNRVETIANGLSVKSPPSL